MVEMIFVLPLLLLLVFAIAEFGLMFSRWLTLSNAVREGAREGVEWAGPTCNPTDTTNRITAKVNSYVQAGGIRPADITLNIQGVCGGTGSQLTVTSTHQPPFHIPFGPPVPSISYSSTMRNE